MRDITHPYLGLGCVPIRAPSPGDRADRESAEMEQIRAEILRLGAVNGPGPDWRTVVDCGVVILRDQRKDLQVACYLVWGLFEREGYTGLAVGLTIIKDMAALYWNDLHPPVDRQKARIGCLDWLAENLANRLDRKAPEPGDGPALERAVTVLVDLEEDLRARFGHRAPPFGHVRRQVAEYLGQLPGPRPENRMPAAPVHEIPPPAPMPAPPRPEPPARPAPAPPRAVTVEATAVHVPKPRETDGKKGADAPSRPRNVKRILTPTERSRRRARIVAAASIVLLVLVVSGGAGAYWLLEVERVSAVAAQLTSPQETVRQSGLAMLETLPERQRASLLHDHADAIVDHYIGRAEEAADDYRFLAADAALAAAEALYPDSARLAAERQRLAARRANLAGDIRARRDAAEERVAAVIDATLPAAEARQARAALDRMLRLIERGDLRNARVALDELAARLPGGDGQAGAAMPALTALAFLDLAERRADQEYFTQSLQAVADGLTFLPENTLLLTARHRYRSGRSEYLLRNTIREPETLDTLLVREAAAQLRAEAPARHRALSRDLAAAIRAAVTEATRDEPERRQRLMQAADQVLGLAPDASAGAGAPPSAS